MRPRVYIHSKKIFLACPVTGYPNPTATRVLPVACHPNVVHRRATGLDDHDARCGALLHDHHSSRLAGALMDHDGFAGAVLHDDTACESCGRHTENEKERKA